MEVFMDRFGLLTVGDTNGLIVLEPVGRKNRALLATLEGIVGP
jgi:hypothetical protein